MLWRTRSNHCGAATNRREKSKGHFWEEWMAVKPDRWIRRKALEDKMIEPFTDRQGREGGISYGVPSDRYDIRAAGEFRVFTKLNLTVVGPESFRSASLVQLK